MQQERISLYLHPVLPLGLALVDMNFKHLLGNAEINWFNTLYHSPLAVLFTDKV